MKITNKLAALSGIALLSLTGAAQALTLSTFTNLANWQAAISGTELGPELFNIGANTQIAGGTATTTPGGFFQVFYEKNTVGNENSNDFCGPDTGCGGTNTLRLRHRPGSGNNDTKTMRFDFFNPINAFAADFSNLDDGDGLSIKVGDQTINLDTFFGTSASGFMGFVITDSSTISSLQFTSSGDDTFNVDNARLVTPNAVPVPAAVWLMGSALMGLIGIGRRKKTV